MKNFLRMAMRFLSEEQRQALYRKMARIPAEYFNPGFTVEIAQSKEDLQSAYKLLHDCYVGIKIIDPQPSGLRCNLFSFLPVATIIVAKIDGKVVGTVSAIKDSVSGLPSDKDFLNENNRLRQQGNVLIEASALAVAPEYRGEHSVSFLLMKYLYNYCRNCFRGDYMIGAVHPKAEDFYKALWKFEKNGEPLQYASLKGAAAIHISMDLSAEHFDRVIEAFGPADPQKNLGSLILGPDDRFFYPHERTGLAIHPVITPQLLKYFCLEQKEIWSRMNPQDQQTLIDIYTTYFGAASMAEFRKEDIQGGPSKEYRTPVQLPCIAEVSTESNFCEVSDLTSRGCFVIWKEVLPTVGSTVRLSLRLNRERYFVTGEVAWSNDGHTLHRGRGFGIRFSQAEYALSSNLQSLLYGPATASQEGKRLSLVGS
jgi:hypothetical protein